MNCMLKLFATAAAATMLVAGAAAAADAPPLKIGVSLSLTGDFADPGKAAQRGYELWADEVNKAGGILGRKVELKIVNDASSPDQVVTNYQNLITQDKVDIVFGPFSSLLTIPSARVAKRYGYAFIEPAGGGPKVFAQHLDNLFFVQPAPVVKGGDIFAKYILSLPKAERPKTAAYAKLDDPFAAPIADYVKKEFEAAGIKTVYDQTYPAESADLTPIVAGYAAKKPDVVVGGTQSLDAFAQVKAMIQLKFNPKWLFLSNGANSPTEFPEQGGRQQRCRRLLQRRLVSGFARPRQQGIHQGLHRQVWRRRVRHRFDLRRGLFLRPPARAGRQEDRQGRQCDDHQDLAQGNLADARGRPELGQVRRAAG